MSRNCLFIHHLVRNFELNCNSIFVTACHVCLHYSQVVAGVKYRLTLRLGELDCLRREDKRNCQVKQVIFIHFNCQQGCAGHIKNAVAKVGCILLKLQVISILITVLCHLHASDSDQL
jgi:hypothetical protein